MDPNSALSKPSDLDEMKTNFVSIAAHELRTPLTSIKGYMSVFMSTYKDALNDDQKSLLGHVEEATNQLLSLVENLLNVSRVERGAMNLSLAPVDMVALAKEIVEQFKGSAVQKSVRLEFVEPTSPIPQIRADKVRIVEVLSNLTGNAINYNRPGGTVRVSVHTEGNELVVAVADNGAGIPKEKIDHLFTKFYRGNEGLTQDNNPQGNGLGLYISKSIIDLHHGRIWVNSEVGKGAIFSFSLPIA